MMVSARPQKHDSPVRDALRACRSAMMALFAFSVAINLLVLASPLYMMQIYDRVLNSRSTETLLVLTVIVVFALVVMSGLEYCRAGIMARVGVVGTQFAPARLRNAVVHCEQTVT